MFVNCEDVHDGFAAVEIPRLDLDPLGKKGIVIKTRLRCGYCVIQPLKMGGETSIVLDDGRAFEAVRQDGIPTLYALVLAVAPYHVPPGGDPSINDEIPTVGDIIVKPLYAAEPLLSPTFGQGVELETLAPMERSTRGLGILSLRDVEAIVQHDTL